MTVKHKQNDTMKQQTLDIGECRTVDGFMRDQVNKQLLRWAAGHCMTCSNCGDILDCESTVSAEVSRNYQNRGEEIISEYVVCGTCWDQFKGKVLEGVERANARLPELNGKVDIVDGRTMDWSND